MQQEVKVKEEWLGTEGSQKAPSKRKRKGDDPDLDEALYQWFSALSKQGDIVNDALLKAKLEEFAQDMGRMDIKATDSWLCRWKYRYGVCFPESEGDKILGGSLRLMPKGNREVYSLLIQEVQNRECLYVPTHPQYKDRQKLESEWTEIGQILGVSGHVAKKTWQNLRSSYTRCLASEKAQSLTGGRKTTWYLKDQMEFLREYMSTMSALDVGRNHNGFDEIGPSTEELVDSYIKEQEKELEDSTNDSGSSFYHSPNAILPTSLKRLKPSSSSYFNDSASPMADTLVRLLTSDSDDDLVFFKGLLPSVRQLTPANNRKFKHSISNYLFEMLDAQEADPGQKIAEPILNHQ
ncbi:uncharacterized protein LOC106059651 [Biomphalaria glabrata]|uniref:Uncharacterized protein LOC106059651 n=1 Tax=Biomphalaria glabrata TaxID=6526 RepID=A0A9W3AC84_BIOGL|nr:uncharacterized protein LOC106059651 [Biomphalaria glabrata]